MDVFEEVKVAWLALTTIVLLGVGASAWLSGRRALHNQSLRLHTPVTPRFWPGKLFGSLKRDPVLFAVLLYVTSAVVSTLNSLSPHTSWRGAAESSAGLWTVLGYLVLFLATRAVCGTSADVRRLFFAVAIGAAGSSVYATIQVLHLDPLHWEGASLFAGFVRPFSTMAHPNCLGAYLVMAVPLVAASALWAARGRRWFAVSVYTLIALLSSAVVVFTLSRAAWLAAVSVFVVLIIGWWVAGVRRACIALVAVPLLCAALGVGSLLTMPFQEGEQVRATLAQRIQRLGDVAGRRHIWRAAWDVFRDHSVSGSGLDTFRLAFGTKRPIEYWQEEGDATPSKAHNEFLHTLATQGLLGGVSIVALFACIGLSAVRSWRRASMEDKPLITAVLASIAGFTVTNLFGFTVVSCGTLFVTCAALLSRWEASTDKAMAFAPVSESGISWRRRLPHIAIAVGTTVAIFFFVIHPVLASLACHRGDGLVATDPHAAIAEYERAVAFDPSNDAYWVKLSAAAQLAFRSAASAKEQNQDLYKARRALERAVELEPADPYHHACLARLLGELAYRGLAEPTPSLREWDAALAFDPRNATLLSEAARTAAALGDFRRVRTLTTRGLSLYPRCASLHAQLGACAYASGYFSEAVATYTEAVKGDWGGDGDGQTRAIASLAAVYLTFSQYDMALHHAAAAIEREPEWTTAHYLAGQALEGLKKSEEARAQFQKVLQLAPGHAGASAALQRIEKK